MATEELKAESCAMHAEPLSSCLRHAAEVHDLGGPPVSVLKYFATRAENLESIVMSASEIVADWKRDVYPYDSMKRLSELLERMESEVMMPNEVKLPEKDWMEEAKGVAYQILSTNGPELTTLDEEIIAAALSAAYAKGRAETLEEVANYLEEFGSFYSIENAKHFRSLKAVP